MGVFTLTTNTNTMKHTKIMLATVATFILTVIFINTIVWYLEDTWTFKECFAHGATIGISVIFGWLPATFVGRDIYEKLNH